MQQIQDFIAGSTVFQVLELTKDRMIEMSES